MGSDNKKIIFGALALGALAGGAYLLLAGGKKDEEEAAADFAPSTKKATFSEDTKQEDAAMVSPSSGGDMARETTTTFSFSANEENEKMLEEAYAEALTQQKVDTKAPKADKTSGLVEFKNLGVSIGSCSGWIVNEEMSPMPNVGMITFQKPEFAGRDPSQQMPGSVPVVILSVEDITSEALSLSEFKDKSKNMALTQMMMMTGGMFQPTVTYDDTMTVGKFGHCLEYESKTPYFTMQVMNLLQVKNGLAFVFQLMANPEIMAEYKPQVMQIAKSIELNVVAPVVDFEAGSCVEVKKSNVQLKVPSTWMETEYPANDDALVSFKTSAITKSEDISVYAKDKAPHTDNATGRKVASNDDYSVVLTAGKGNTSNVIVTGDDTLAAVLSSIKASSGEANPIFRAAKHGYEFDIVAGGKIIESRLGDGTVVYAPNGIPNPQDPNSATDGPIVTIRTGDKKTDPDCESTLDEWFGKLKADSEEAPIMELRKSSVNGVECITFLNKEMQETGQGQKEERQGRVYIFVVNEITTLIRWETSTGNWRKFERKLEAMMNSFKLI